MEIDTAIRSGETRCTTANHCNAVTVTIVAAIMRTNFNLATNTTITRSAITLSLEANTISIAHLRTLADSAVGSRVSRHAHTCAIVTKSIDALTTHASGTVRTKPASSALANAIHAFAALAAICRAVFVSTLLPKESGQAITCSIVAISVARAVGGACEQRAIVPLEPGITGAHIIDA